MAPRVDNSFYHQDLSDLKVLVIVPHEDDEINTCGSLLHMLSDCGSKITLVYTTNGDWKYNADTRMREAVAAAAFLGVHEKNLFFLGYGDSINNDQRDHLFYSDNGPVMSTSGHTETYGTKEYPDYVFAESGKHHAYTKHNYLEDVISIIVKTKADLIICTDFDEHPDHRMLSLYFDKAIGIIKREDPGYSPEVWKRFAYALAYTAIPDYSAVNNPETKRPTGKTTGKYELDLVDRSIYTWGDRIRIPVYRKEDERLQDNLIAKALLKHRSQMIITHADSIINSDEVYWRRRTDSISYAAGITTSSGNGQFLNDFMIYNVDDVDSKVPRFVDYCWRPDPDDRERKAVFTWDTPQQLEHAILYGAVSESPSALSIEISLDDGYTKQVRDIPGNGNPIHVDLGHHEGITTCTLRIVDFSDSCGGLSECEFYSARGYSSSLKPYCKLMVSDNFAYDYVIDDGIEYLPLTVYDFGLEGKKHNIEVVRGRSEIIDQKVMINPIDEEIVLRCSVDETGAWDQIVIKRLTEKQKKSYTERITADRNYLRKKRRLLKVHNMLYILKRKGPMSVVKRTIRNVILPGLRKR